MCEESSGIGARVSDEGREGLRTDVEDGSKGCVLEGVSRAFRFVEMLSSMLARDNRRKSRNTRVLKQNCGVSWVGVAVGSDIMSAASALDLGDVDGACRGLCEASALMRGEGGRGGDSGEGVFQNHASLTTVHESSKVKLVNGGVCRGMNPDYLSKEDFKSAY